ncbi:hypothetical protein GCM10010495_48570 [Kitasatospora herbaricolor]|uniref:DUF5999 family protein n=1 Tax=Kitasatospora herbaricolor TaxID=68217 RepID=UPI0019BF9AA2|nr:DUF5999 family protein [Kitasatospora herbaricolor]MDQ0305776.1 hypothetical protein [Kitasatospora herbaricolor]GGV26877.1 hypothetical protein GCM10010495_48570 [Kitasatospora herbaricolor]
MAVLVGHRLAATAAQENRNGRPVAVTRYADGAWTAVHGPGHPPLALLAASAVPEGLALFGSLIVASQEVEAVESRGPDWVARACQWNGHALVVVCPADDLRIPHLTPILLAAPVGAPSPCTPDPESPVTCTHRPECPAFEEPDAGAAVVIASHPVQGWGLLCNGILTFEDTGGLRPDGRQIPPSRTQPAERAA